ncbi:MAG: acetylglutamate kinase [Myxococcota bacterium]|jgi:acetylglutamate kinase|nr:acetylglutamate kinase [Myxococcota bacterium]
MSEPLVIKLGGELLADHEQCRALASDVAQLCAQRRVVVVHGGGPQATALSKSLGLSAKKVGGRRITDRDTLEVMKMVLGGQVNIDLCAMFHGFGLPAVGLSGSSAGLVQAVKRPPRAVSGSDGELVDFGYVGDITSINTSLLNTLCDAGYVPVMNSLGIDPAGQVYNINADVAATRVAAALSAKLVMSTGGVRGVLRELDDPNSRFTVLSPEQARAAIAEGVIAGGMIPKVEEGLGALALGVVSVHIVGCLQPGDLLAELNEAGSVGTALQG